MQSVHNILRNHILCIMPWFTCSAFMRIPRTSVVMHDCRTTFLVHISELAAAPPTLPLALSMQCSDLYYVIPRTITGDTVDRRYLMREVSRTLHVKVPTKPSALISAKLGAVVNIEAIRAPPRGPSCSCTQPWTLWRVAPL